MKRSQLPIVNFLHYFRFYFVAVATFVFYTFAVLPIANASEPRYLPVDTSKNGIHSEKIYEPVFNSEVTIYTAGSSKKPALVLVHGIGEDGAAVWANIIHELAKSHYIIAMDLPGFGRSTRADRLYSPEKYSRLVEFLVHEKLANRDFTLIGHSMGGSIALYYAATYPNRLKNMVILDAAGLMHRSKYVAYLSKLGIPDNLLGSKASKTLLNDIVSSVLSEAELYQNIDLMNWLSSSTIRTTLLRGNVNAIAGAALIATNYNAIIRNITVPSLIIWGENDAVAPLRTGHMLASLLPQSQLIALENVAHVPMHDSPERVVAVIKTFLQNPDKTKPMPWPSHENSSQANADSSVPNNANKEDLNCLNSSNKQYGTHNKIKHYDHIQLINCQSVVLTNITANSIRIINSRVVLNNVQIANTSGIALDVSASRVEINGGRISAPLAIQTSDSSLDIYGSHVQTNQTAFQSSTGGRTKIVFSLASIERLGKTELVHKVVELDDTETF